MKNTLYQTRFKQILNSIQSSKEQENIFLLLLQNAKQVASDDIRGNCPEYSKAWDIEMKLMDEMKEVSSNESVIKHFNKYVDAAEETNNIWAEEMYLRGIQDAFLFMGMINKTSVSDINGIVLQAGNK